MNVQIVLENNGKIPKGLDWAELEEGIQRNVETFVKATKGEIVSKDRQSPPDTAQGEDQIIQWLLEVATNPKMAIVYYRMICFTLNEIINASRKRADDHPETDTIGVRIKVLGKEIQLPAAVSSIEEFLKSISE